VDRRLLTLVAGLTIILSRRQKRYSLNAVPD